jgi:pre-mRNA-splicing factor SYF1
MFHYPHVLDLWIAYLTKFVERYGGEKLERCRDLFEQALSGVPAEHAKTLYIMYGHVEENYGLARHAMSVYARACRAVADADKPYLYQIYLNRAALFFGVTRTREIYEQAIGKVPVSFLLLATPTIHSFHKQRCPRDS